MATPLIPVIEVVELVALAALTAAVALLAVRSLPAALLQRQRRVETLVADIRTELQQIVDERAIWKAQGERLAEEVSTYLDQIERKRSSTAASAARIKTATVPAQRVEDMDRAGQIAVARRMLGG